MGGLDKLCLPSRSSASSPETIRVKRLPPFLGELKLAVISLILGGI
jgi:hypothetical protein